MLTGSLRGITITGTWFRNDELRITKDELNFRITKGKYDVIFIVLLWLVCTAVNIRKPFHIDDTFHLEAARLIAQHPLEPMSGMVNWTDVPEPVHHFNQPPGYLYLVAIGGELFGYSEIPLHLVQSLFTLIAIIFFFRISLLVCPGHARFLTLLFALSPAFIVNQNLMTDVPLVSLSLLSVYLMIRPSPGSGIRNDVLAAVVIGIAILTKYTALPLLVVLAVSVLWKRRFAHLAVLLIPLAMVAIWSWWNIREFGYAHILGRERDPIDIHDILGTSLSYLACLGAVAPFTLAVFSGTAGPRRWLTFSVPAVFFLFLAFAAGSMVGMPGPNLSKEIIRYLFLLNGILLVVSLSVIAVRGFGKRNNGPPFGHAEVVLLFCFLGFAAFIIRYSPFIATRHILLVVPPALLIGSRVLSGVASTLKVQAAVATAALGILLGISDWLYADFYRQGAAEAAGYRTGEERMWSAGHWGWQWYAAKQGMLPYDSVNAEIWNGDLLVVPSDVATQHIDTSLQLQRVKKIWHQPGLFTFLSTAFNAGFYMSTYRHPAWRFSRQPSDTINIYRASHSIQSNPVKNN